MALLKAAGSNPAGKVSHLVALEHLLSQRLPPIEVRPLLALPRRAQCMISCYWVVAAGVSQAHMTVLAGHGRTFWVAHNLLQVHRKPALFPALTRPLITPPGLHKQSAVRVVCQRLTRAALPKPQGAEAAVQCARTHEGLCLVA